jgi:hypothetical protein
MDRLEKDKRISMIRQRTSLILKIDWTFEMAGSRGQETKCRKAESGCVKLPLDKIMKYY